METAMSASNDELGWINVTVPLMSLDERLTKLSLFRDRQLFA